MLSNATILDEAGLVAVSKTDAEFRFGLLTHHHDRCPVVATSHHLWLDDRGP